VQGEAQEAAQHRRKRGPGHGRAEDEDPRSQRSSGPNRNQAHQEDKRRDQRVQTQAGAATPNGGGEQTRPERGAGRGRADRSTRHRRGAGKRAGAGRKKGTGRGKGQGRRQGEAEKAREPGEGRGRKTTKGTKRRKHGKASGEGSGDGYVCVHERAHGGWGGTQREDFKPMCLTYEFVCGLAACEAPNVSMYMSCSSLCVCRLSVVARLCVSVCMENSSSYLCCCRFGKSRRGFFF